MSLRPEGLSLSRVCQLLGMPRSSYYYARQRADPASPISRKAAHAATINLELRDRIEALCLEFPRYGSPRVTKQLQREGWQVNHKRVERILKEECLLCQVKRSFVCTTQSNHHLKRYPNLIKELLVTQLNQVWVADITYIRLQEEFLYLAVILDSCSRRVIGWELDNTLEARLCVKALEMALRQRQPKGGFAAGSLIHHSDQGVQYASAAYTSLLEQATVQISMSRRGNPYDNARAESFMRTLKQEEVYLIERYVDIRHAKERIGHFLLEVYNQKRLHSSLDYLPPVEFEANQQTPSR